MLAASFKVAVWLPHSTHLMEPFLLLLCNREESLLGSITSDLPPGLIAQTSPLPMWFRPITIHPWGMASGRQELTGHLNKMRAPLARKSELWVNNHQWLPFAPAVNFLTLQTTLQKSSWRGQKIGEYDSINTKDVLLNEGCHGWREKTRQFGRLFCNIHNQQGNIIQHIEGNWQRKK